MIHRAAFLFVLPLVASLLPAQEDAKVKLARMVTDAAGNAGKLVEAATFARTNKLDSEATKILEGILEDDPDNKAVHEALGHKREGDEWLGEIQGLWIPADQLADARRGIYRHRGERVNRWEKERLLKGHVRHKWTKLLIAPEDKAKADAGQFPLQDGQWGDFQAAEKLHSNNASPWVVKTEHFYVVSSLPFNTITKEVWAVVDSVYPKIRTICGGEDCHPDRPPVIWVLPKTQDYVQFGNDFGAEGSAHGAFSVDPGQFTMRIAGGSRPVAAANWGAQGWGPYYVRHAAALALARSYFGDEAAAVPLWFHRGLAGYSSRLYDAPIAKAFGVQHLKAGHPEDLGKWLSGFRISGDNPTRGKGTNDYNIFQAGLLISFCMRGGDRESTDGLMAVTEAVRAGKGIANAVRELQKVLGGKTAQVAAYLEKICQ